MAGHCVNSFQGLSRLWGSWSEASSRVDGAVDEAGWRNDAGCSLPVRHEVWWGPFQDLADQVHLSCCSCSSWGPWRRQQPLSDKCERSWKRALNEEVIVCAPWISACYILSFAFQCAVVSEYLCCCSVLLFRPCSALFIWNGWQPSEEVGWSKQIAYYLTCKWDVF